ncbi:MAG: chorismate-binding protein, partial [Cyanobacteria bacterium P01_H01_bin.130]
MASITLPIPSVDLLQIFSHINQSQSLSFYWEKRDRNCAMVAIESAIKTTVIGPNRFQAARDWIQHHSQRLMTVDPAGDGLQARFLCGFPFLDDGPAATVFLPRWQITTHQGDRPRTIALLNCTINPHDSVDELWQRYHHQLEKIQAWGGDRGAFSPYAPLPLPHRQSWKIPDLRNDLGDGQGFIDGVQRAIADIQAGYLRKVVLSHVLDLRLRGDTHPASLLHNLRQRYPNCYTFAFGTGTGQTFLGASPECLIRIQGDQAFPQEFPQQPRTLYTEALAGSAPRGR